MEPCRGAQPLHRLGVRALRHTCPLLREAPGAAAAGPSARSPMSAVALIPGALLDKSPGRLGASVRGGGSQAGRTSGVAQGERRQGAGARGRGERGFSGLLGWRVRTESPASCSGLDSGSEGYPGGSGERSHPAPPARRAPATVRWAECRWNGKAPLCPAAPGAGAAAPGWPRRMEPPGPRAALPPHGAGPGAPPAAAAG